MRVQVTGFDKDVFDKVELMCTYGRSAAPAGGDVIIARAAGTKPIVITAAELITIDANGGIALTSTGGTTMNPTCDAPVILAAPAVHLGAVGSVPGPWVGAYLWGGHYHGTGAGLGVNQWYQTVEAALTAGFDTIRFNLDPTSPNSLVRDGVRTIGVIRRRFGEDRAERVALHAVHTSTAHGPACRASKDS